MDTPLRGSSVFPDGCRALMDIDSFLAPEQDSPCQPNLKFLTPVACLFVLGPTVTSEGYFRPSFPRQLNFFQPLQASFPSPFGFRRILITFMISALWHYWRTLSHGFIEESA